MNYDLEQGLMRANRYFIRMLYRKHLHPQLRKFLKKQKAKWYKRTYPYPRLKASFEILATGTINKNTGEIEYTSIRRDAFRSDPVWQSWLCQYLLNEKYLKHYYINSKNNRQ